MVYFVNKNMKIKKIINSFILIFVLVLAFGAFTFAENFVFTNLGISADILIDWTINVSETYTADFFTKMHGIFRTIPLNYSVEWDKFHIDVTNINVSWKKFKTSESKWVRTIKIWDSKEYVYWTVNYPISYTTYWLIRNFSWMWYAELYWNIVWHDFETSIGNVTAVINLPKIYTGFKSSDFLITADWITNTTEQFQWNLDWSEWDRIVITYDKWLSAHQWITLSIKFPNNYFEFDDERQAKLVWNARNWGILWFLSSIDESDFAAVFVFIFFIPFFIVKYLKRKVVNNWRIYRLKWEFAKKYKVIVQYQPPEWLNSAEVWLLLHRDAKIKDLFSLVYKRAAEWLIKIDADISEKVFWVIKTWSIKIKKLKDIPESAPNFEKIFFRRFISWSENGLSKYDKEHFLDLERLKTHWIQRKWLKNKSKDVVISTPLAILMGVLFLLGDYVSPIFIVFLVIVALFFGINSYWKTSITDKWAELIAHILWYRQFLVACDEKQLRTFLKQDPLYFDKTLPYAVVFWVETDFLKKITPIMEEYNITPTWYKWRFINFNRVLSGTNAVWNKSVYTKSGWFGSWSSFWWWFHGWWWGWWWGW